MKHFRVVGDEVLTTAGEEEIIAAGSSLTRGEF